MSISNHCDSQPRPFYKAPVYAFADGKWEQLDADPLDEYDEDSLDDFEWQLENAGYEPSELQDDSEAVGLIIHRACNCTRLTEKYRFVVEARLGDGSGDFVFVKNLPDLLALTREIRFEAIASRRGTDAMPPKGR